MQSTDSKFEAHNFHWNCDTNYNALGIADASELGLKPGETPGRLKNTGTFDSTRFVILHSRKTGKLMEFEMSSWDKNGWTFKSTTDKKISIIIVND